MKYIASCSFGKDSLAMVLLLIEMGYQLDEVIFFNTGMEFEAIYNVRDRLIPILEERGIKYTELEPQKPFLYNMLERPVESKKRVAIVVTVGVVAFAAGERQKKTGLLMNTKRVSMMKFTNTSGLPPMKRGGQKGSIIR